MAKKQSLAAREKEARERLVSAATSRGLINPRDVAVLARDGRSARTELLTAERRHERRKAKLEEEVRHLTGLLETAMPEPIQAAVQDRLSDACGALGRAAETDPAQRVSAARTRRVQRAQVIVASEGISDRLATLEERVETLSASAQRRARKSRAKLLSAVS